MHTALVSLNIEKTGIQARDFFKLSYLHIDIGSLNVYAEEIYGIPNTPNPKTLLWTVSRSQSNSWYRARVSTEFNKDFRIIFEGKFHRLINL